MLRIERRCSPMLIFLAWATCGFKKYPKNVALSFEVINKRPLRGGSRGRVHGVHIPPPFAEMTCGFRIQLVFCKKKKTMWLIGVEVEQETSAPPPKKKILDPPLPLHRISIAHRLRWHVVRGLSAGEGFERREDFREGFFCIFFCRIYILLWPQKVERMVGEFCALIRGKHADVQDSYTTRMVLVNAKNQLQACRVLKMAV